MELPTLAEIEAAAKDIIYPTMPPTPQYPWPLLAERCGCEVVVKHENHTPTGAFKVRGGLVYLHQLKATGETRGVVSATRGNHGQSLAFAGRRTGTPVVIVVPEHNNPEKNAAMAAFGAEVVVHGQDFDAARKILGTLAAQRNLHEVPSFHPWLICGVASYWLELFRAHPDLDAVYVPIGMGSGIVSALRVRDLLGHTTEIIGVVAEKAPAFAHSVAEGRVVTTATADTFADGMACREPHPDAVEIVRRGAARVVTVGEEAIAQAIVHLYRDTHNLAEGAGAAGLAALLQERQIHAGRKVGLTLCGGNIDLATFIERCGRTALHE
ncbi:MAG: threonine dehydratase [Candidatus Competibacterales bacterium]